MGWPRGHGGRATVGLYGRRGYLRKPSVQVRALLLLVVLLPPACGCGEFSIAIAGRRICHERDAGAGAAGCRRVQDVQCTKHVRSASGCWLLAREACVACPY